MKRRVVKKGFQRFEKIVNKVDKAFKFVRLCKNIIYMKENVPDSIKLLDDSFNSAHFSIRERINDELSLSSNAVRFNIELSD